jgi:hypothetical protein
MALHYKPEPEQRRFLAINFWVGTSNDGYLVGPALVSTSDYQQFHYWDEPSAATLGEDDYEILKVYRLGLTYAEAVRQFTKDFPPTAIAPYRSAGWIAPGGTFYSAEGWVALGRPYVVSA